MIISNFGALGGKSTTIQTNEFKCRIVTAKEGLFQKQSTMIILLDEPVSGIRHRVIGKIIYSPSLRSKDRLAMHDVVVNGLDVLGGSQIHLKEAIEEVFHELKKRGIIAEAINLADELADPQYTTVKCKKCGTNNRIGPHHSKLRPICAKCKSYLIEQSEEEEKKF